MLETVIVIAAAAVSLVALILSLRNHLKVRRLLKKIEERRKAGTSV